MGRPCFPSFTRIFCCLHLTPEQQRSQDWARCGSGSRFWLKAFPPRKQGAIVPVADSPSLLPSPTKSVCVCVCECVYVCVCMCACALVTLTGLFHAELSSQSSEDSIFISRTSCRAARGLCVLDVFSYSCFSCKNNYGSENIFKNVV